MKNHPFSTEIPAPNETMCFLPGLEHRTSTEVKQVLSTVGKTQNVLRIIFELEDQL